VLGTLGPDGLAAAVAAADRAALGRAPGVGPRLAARITAELKDRLGAVAGASAPAGLPEVAPVAGDDALAALVRLGFGRVEAAAAVGRVRGRLGEGAALDAVIRGCLAELAA
jgi:Holliday junction DNA helicase RuvA